MSFKEWLHKTFGPEGLFSSGQENHAFLIGISEVICPWKPHWDVPEGYEANGNPFKEYHYYMFGRASGIIFWLIVAVIIKASW